MTGLEVLAASVGGAAGVGLGLQSIRVNQRHQPQRNHALAEQRNVDRRSEQRVIALVVLEELGDRRVVDLAVVERARLYADVAASVDVDVERASAHHALMDLWQQTCVTQNDGVDPMSAAALAAATDRIASLETRIEADVLVASARQRASFPKFWSRS